METHQSLNNIQCVELERLATAAAAMDYNSPLSPGQANSSTEIEAHNQVMEHVQGSLSAAHSSRTSQMEPHLFSYVNHSQISKGHSQFIPRTYRQTEQSIKEETHSVQSITGSRIIMVNNSDSVSSNIQYSRNAPSQFTFYEEYQNDVENSIQTSYSQPVVTSCAEIMNYKSFHIEPDKTGETSEYSENIDSESSKKNREIGNKSKKGTKQSENSKIDSEKDLCRSHTAESASNENFFSCKFCSLSFETEGGCLEHQSDHIMPKRNGLSLELKIEIIKRVNSGERKADMAEEYGVNTSTIKSIMKKSESYLNCWKKGMFKPDSKRLKGPKREDVEEAIYFWYQQAIENEAPVSGPILCAKAMDFAKKLGHMDFKPTHGWLDRFKKRKKIVFGRSSSKRRREDKMQEPYNALFSKVLNDYESQNIFAIDFFGMCYRTLPSQIDTLKGLKCAGGVKSKERFSIVLCTNMTGSEKFPLLVVGRSQPLNFCPKSTKNFPVHFVLDQYSWLTSEIISSWLLDMDSCFVQQGRKVLLLCPPSPIYSDLPKFRAVKFVILPPGWASPLRQEVVPYFKKSYRKKLLEELLLSASRSKPPFTPHFSIITCLHLLASSWQALSDNIIVSGFQLAGLIKYSVWGMIPAVDNTNIPGAQETFNSAMHLLNNVPSESTFDEFVHFDDNVQVCNLMEDEDIIAKVRGISDDDEVSEDNQERVDEERPSLADVEKAFEVLRKYIQYQEGAQEMFRVLSHLEYIIYKNVSEELM